MVITVYIEREGLLFHEYQRTSRLESSAGSSTGDTVFPINEVYDLRWRQTPLAIISDNITAKTATL